MSDLRMKPLAGLTPWNRVPLLSTTLTHRDAALALKARIQSSKSQNKGAMSRLRKEVKKRFGVGYASFYMGGRASLFAVMRVLELKPGDEVVIPAFTCQCVVNGLRYQGVSPVYADIELDTYGMDAKRAAEVITPNTRAILIQHTFGLPGRDLEALLALACEKGLYVIEDCAHATGGSWQGRPLGTLGDIGFFSSERSKIINTIHGGFVITASTELGERLKRDEAACPSAPPEFMNRLFATLIHNYLTLASPFRQILEPLGRWIPSRWVLPQMHAEEFTGERCEQYHWRMPEALAPMMLHQLNQVEPTLKKRRQAAAMWASWATEYGFCVPAVPEGADPTWLRFPLRMDPSVKENPESLEKELGVTVGVWFQSAAHPLPLSLSHCPNGMEAARTCINLPTLLPRRYIRKG